MSVLEAILLGAIQGFTEFLPVSSSGHLVMGQWLLGIPMPGVAIEVVLHFATLLSVIIVYRKRLLRLARGMLDRETGSWWYALLLVVATIPAGLVGLFLQDQFEALFDAPAVTGYMLLVTGVLLFSTRWVRNADTRDDVQLPAAIAMGIGQAFAILPGVSRSGTTITVGLWGRLDAEKAAEFSFLMSIPAIAGATVLQTPHIGTSVETVGIATLASGFLAALLCGVAAIESLLWLVRRERFHLFAYYVWPVGVLFLLLLHLQTL